LIAGLFTPNDPAPHPTLSRPGHTRLGLEAPNEKVTMELAIHRADDFNMETLVAIPVRKKRGNLLIRKKNYSFFSLVDGISFATFSVFIRLKDVLPFITSTEWPVWCLPWYFNSFLNVLKGLFDEIINYSRFSGNPHRLRTVADLPSDRPKLPPSIDGPYKRTKEHVFKPFKTVYLIK
jgi:hypothetical protein